LTCISVFERLEFFEIYITYFNYYKNLYIGDIGLVAEYLRQQDFVKKDALNVIGWGIGGAISLF
jgi:hypothetical protein